MKTALIFLMVLFLAGRVHGQFQFDLVQGYTMPYALNPAYSGVENYLDIKLGTRQHWTKLSTAPKTNTIGINANLAIFGERTRVYEKYPETFSGVSKNGMSLFYLNDEFGPFSNQSIILSYAYHLPLSRALYLAAGASGQGNMFRLDLSQLIPRELDDPTYQALLNGQVPHQQWAINTGVALYGKRFYVGYSVFDVAGRDVRDTEVRKDLMAIQSVQAGGNVNLSYHWQLYASGIARMQGNATYWDGALKVRYNEKISLGGMYRSQGAIAGLLGITVAPFFINYSYEFRSSSTALGNTHEVGIGIALRDYLSNKTHSLKPYFL